MLRAFCNNQTHTAFTGDVSHRPLTPSVNVHLRVTNLTTGAETQEAELPTREGGDGDEVGGRGTAGPQHGLLEKTRLSPADTVNLSSLSQQSTVVTGPGRSCPGPEQPRRR